MENLKLSDLRHGNKLLFLGEENTFEYVTQIREDGVFWIKTKENGDMYHKNFHFKPIPITEEWLLKFYFHKDNYGIYEKVKNNNPYVSGCEIELWVRQWKIEETLFWDICIGEDFGNLMHLAFIQHVHQLQNLYFGIKQTELEIKK